MRISLSPKITVGHRLKPWEILNPHKFFSKLKLKFHAKNLRSIKPIGKPYIKLKLIKQQQQYIRFFHIFAFTQRQLLGIRWRTDRKVRKNQAAAEAAAVVVCCLTHLNDWWGVGGCRMKGGCGGKLQMTCNVNSRAFASDWKLLRSLLCTRSNSYSRAYPGGRQG